MAARLQILTYLNFIHDVEGILVASVGEDDLDQSVCQTVRRSFAFKGVPKVGVRIGDPRVTPENNETSYGDEDKRQDFDDPDGILEPV